EGACAELGVCKRCNATYLVGSTTRRDGDVYLVPRQARQTPSWFILSEAAQIAPLADEDDETLERIDAALGELVGHWWCSRCGRLHDEEPVSCGCGGRALRHVLQVPRDGRSCALCGGRSNAGQIRLFESGRDAAVAVLAT